MTMTLTSTNTRSTCARGETRLLIQTLSDAGHAHDGRVPLLSLHHTDAEVEMRSALKHARRTSPGEHRGRARVGVLVPAAEQPWV